MDRGGLGGGRLREEVGGRAADDAGADDYGGGHGVRCCGAKVIVRESARAAGGSVRELESMLEGLSMPGGWHRPSSRPLSRPVVSIVSNIWQSS